MTQWLNTSNVVPKARVALVGPTRGGKTEICSTFPRPAFIFPRNEDSKTTLAGKNILYKEWATVDQLNAILDELEAWGRSGDIHQMCDTICMESLSHGSDIIKAWATPRGVKGDLDEVVWNKYNAVFTRIRDVLWALPVHVVVTMLDKVKTDKRGNVIDHGPRIYGQSGDTLISSCSIVAYCEQEPAAPNQPPQWSAYVQRYGAFPAGTRLPGMPTGRYISFNFPDHIAPYLGEGPAAS